MNVPIRIAISLLILSGCVGSAPAQGASGGDSWLPEAVVPEAFGPNVHITGPDEDFDLMEKAGFGFMRKDMFWNSVERSRGSYDFGTYDRIYESMNERGIRCLFILCYGNEIYPKAETSEEGREAYARFAAAAVEHFRGRGIIWEIWNEPNVKHFWKGPGDHNSKEFAEQYLALVRAAVPAMRQADPDCFIAVTATSCLWKNSFRWLEHLFENGLLKEDVNAVSVHPYGFRRPEHAIDKGYGHLREMMAAHGAPADFPIINSEVGYDIFYIVKMGAPREQALDLQASLCARQHLVDMMCNVRLTIWYKWKCKDFGVVNSDRSERPTWRAAQTLVNQLRGYRFRERIVTSRKEDFLLLFDKPTGEMKLAAWTAPPSGEDNPAEFRPHPVVVPVGTASCVLNTTDVYGSQDAVSVNGGSMSLMLTGAPQYVELCGPRAAADTGTTGASAPAARAEPSATEVGVAMFDEFLFARLSEACVAGRTPRFFSSTVRAKLTVQSLRDDRSLRAIVERTRTEFVVRWDKLSLTERAALAVSLIREGNATDNAIAAFFLLASGDRVRGEECMSAAGELAAEVRAAFN